MSQNDVYMTFATSACKSTFPPEPDGRLPTNRRRRRRNVVGFQKRAPQELWYEASRHDETNVSADAPHDAGRRNGKSG
jgi:hypothetical protein